MSNIPEYLRAIDEKLSEYLNIKHPQIIGESMRYSVFAGGKRVRPLLCILTGTAFGAVAEDCLPFASALEMIHAYSLIHDDLPAMDNDDLRRGKPTNHIVYGEAMAILAGDGLLNRAYEVMASHAAKGNIRGAQAMAAIAAAAGAEGMIGGQVVDILSEGQEIDGKTLAYIHENKTAALISAAMEAGAMLGGAQEEIYEVKKAGYYLGRAFQIKDDLLDLLSDSKTLGKPTGSDEKNKKNTYITMYGIDKSHIDYEEYSLESINILLKLNLKNNGIIDYIKGLTKRIN